MLKGQKCKFKYTASENPPILIYIGYNWSGNGYWHQFTKEGELSVWSEVADSDLYLIEPVQ